MTSEAIATLKKTKHLLWFIVLQSFLCGAAAMERDRFVPFESQQIILTDPNSVCTYEGVLAACNQLMITLYRQGDAGVLGLPAVVKTIRSHGGSIVGQIPDLLKIQIEVSDEDKLHLLAEVLRGMDYVRDVQFNVVASFE